MGGFVLTPSAHPYIPPLSLVVAIPGGCDGWCVKLEKVRWLSYEIYVPIVHYFAEVNGRLYEYYNYYTLSDSVFDNVANYFYRLVYPKWVAMPLDDPNKLAARVVLVVPAPVVLFVMIVALATKLYYGGRRVW